MFEFKNIRFYENPEALSTSKNIPYEHYYSIGLKQLGYQERDFDIRNMIEKVVFNAPATIILWKDGTKTVVKCEGEAYDPEKGLAMAISKKMLGNRGNYYEVFKEWLPIPYEVETDDEDVSKLKQFMAFANAVVSSKDE